MDNDKRYNKELEYIKALDDQKGYKLILEIVSFLKDNNLSLGYTCGTTSSSYINYKLGLSNINPLDYDLIFERNTATIPFWGILLDKLSCQKLFEFYKEKKITNKQLENLNINIAYDKRLDSIINHKRFTYKQLSSMASKLPNDFEYYSINNFNEYIDHTAFKTHPSIKEFWFHQLNRNGYDRLRNNYKFMNTNNTFGLIVYQEEWMALIKQLTGLSYNETYTLMKSVAKKQNIENFITLLNKHIKAKKEDKMFLINLLIDSSVWVVCKAHIVSEAYINLLSSSNEK